MQYPKLVIFDCDGIITETAELHYEAWKQVSKDYFDLILDEKFLNRFRGLSRDKSLDLILKVGEINYLEDDKREEIILKKNAIYKNLITDKNKVKAFETTIEMIHQLKEKGILIALASISKNARQLLEVNEIVDLFDYIADPHNIKNSKPAPDIFLDARDHFNLTSQECWGVEDAKVGVQAINSAGMLSIGVGDLQEISQADIQFDNISKLSLENIERIMKEKNIT
ncbi:beta-phosphoglucomutase [Spiroplasma chinense]|uniref:Beta-phosphoglucomutase n=1 Tax=Spiroplasma chinense TaxID=216932 RepID=A0A5B9Y3Q9_9MOLU|nr:beta-phosphoglucomutase [Spiroplasma chinense]QEH61704.1 beta-phosphoglucomutase [Spiroplasma chinense]